MVRVKRRYFVFQFHFQTHSHPSTLVKSSQIHSTLETMIGRLYGDIGVARFTRNLSVIYYNPSTHVAIVRCLRDDKHMLQTAAAFVSRLTNDPVDCSIQTLHVGGSIRQCKKYLVNYCIEQLLQMNPASNSSSQATPSQVLFKGKKKKSNQHQQQSSMEVNYDKQAALQKLLSDSRIESGSIVVSKFDTE